MIENDSLQQTFKGGYDVDKIM